MMWDAVRALALPLASMRAMPRRRLMTVLLVHSKKMRD